jgi:hypothetical protein
MAIVNQPRDFQFWNNISVTPPQFNLDAGAYGLALTATTFGTAALQKLLPDGVTFVTVSAVVSANGYQELHLPAGQYQLLLTGIVGLIGEIALIAPGSD